MSREVFYDDEGLEHGTTKQWDRNGKLLGQYTLENGSGIGKKWHENGQLDWEYTELRGQLHGRWRCWEEDGEIITTEWYILGKKFQKRSTMKHLKIILRYQDIQTTSKAKNQKKLQSRKKR